MRKRIFKWALSLGLVAAGLIALLLVFRNPLARINLEHRIHDQTGMEVKIGKFSSSRFPPTITIENLKLYNTAEFGSGVFLDLPELHLEMDPTAFAQRKLHITVARLNLAELNVVKNEAGRTNIMSMRRKKPPGASEKEKVRKLMGDLKFGGIDALTLSLGKARFIDLKDATRNRELSLGLQNQVLKNIQSEADIYGALLIIWLRTGGGFPINPADFLKNSPGQTVETSEIKTNPLPVLPAPQ